MTDSEAHDGGARTTSRIPGDRVVSEVIDGEVVAIDLESGRYYSLEGAAARAWEALRDGQDVDGIAAVVADEAGLSAEDVRPDVSAFVAELTAEGLLSPGGDGAAAPGPGRVPLILNRYTDMQDLIVLDPIHDVDETGWPNRRPE
ncbi:MAG TPA: PqqD family protein [Solirubrobacterales bacterium]|nr:PqqD family protein [Solirubrobacterales bacterium]